MRVSEIIEELQSKVIKLKEKYCENCQEWECCYCCPFELERGSEDGRSDQ